MLCYAVLLFWAAGLIVFLSKPRIAAILSWLFLILSWLSSKILGGECAGDLERRSGDWDLRSYACGDLWLPLCLDWEPMWFWLWFTLVFPMFCLKGEYEFDPLLWWMRLWPIFWFELFIDRSWAAAAIDLSWAAWNDRSRASKDLSARSLSACRCPDLISKSLFFAVSSDTCYLKALFSSIRRAFWEETWSYSYWAVVLSAFCESNLYYRSFLYLVSYSTYYLKLSRSRLFRSFMFRSDSSSRWLVSVL